MNRHSSNSKRFFLYPPSFTILQHTKTTIFPIEYNFPTLSLFSSHSTSKETTTLSHNFNNSFSNSISLNVIFNPRLFNPSLHSPLLLTLIKHFLKKEESLSTTSQLDPNSNTLSEKKPPSTGISHPVFSQIRDHLERTSKRHKEISSSSRE